ncbi:hypothetical protein BCR41DRAFT_356395 [Lobosporangium transversale]|uniref:Crinkler effector protein N-terminal domain-containing protein n=1 Tax=Lobosporangium transversale TaxID=64571 RepID=A0A1Y2GII2_9FUNG|nr:hypothetical protein BCR41DRAFT_356395 [Lobosporangium transversale]ORZ12045.1 hypothetical protein BCR41DRAFT_356395 [Lobosporangium transversale]|eukprot:XP_021879910.1 hypothetical protein BCR41DRAFT_356395 [Lobosporangium transversale]
MLHNTITTNQITLFCLVDGESTSNAFSVEIDPTKTVDGLKKHIKAEKTPPFDDVAADELTLWHVSIVIGDDEDEKTITLSEHPNAKKLRATSEISEIFGTAPEKKTIHVIVQRPSADQSTSTSNLEKKRTADDLCDLLSPVLKKKRWTVNGAIRFIDIKSVYYVDTAKHDVNRRILSAITNHELAMHWCTCVWKDNKVVWTYNSTS